MVVRSHWLEDARIGQRCIGITAEQPASPFFDTNVHLGSKLADLLVALSLHALMLIDE